MSNAAPAPVPNGPPPAIGLVAVAAAFTGLFWFTFSNLIPVWLNDASYGHSGAVALVSVAFVAFRAYRIQPDAGNETQAGMAFFLGGVAQTAAIVVNSSLAALLAIVFVGRGVALLVGGRNYAARFTFPLLLVVFLFRLPDAWTGYAALWLQDVVSRFSETVLSLFVVCTRTGHTIRIAGLDQSLVIAEECSGLRQILAFVACAAIYGALFQPRWIAHRVALVLVSVPVAIIANVLRVVLMNLAAAKFGTNWMSTWMHDLPALFGLPVGVFLFFLSDRVLFGLFGKPPEPEMVAPRPPAPGVGRRLVIAAGVTAGLAAGNFALYWHLHSAPIEYSQLSAPVASTPLAFGDPEDGWVGRELAEQRQATIPKLGFVPGEILYRDYVHTAKRAGAQLYMVSSPTGEDRKHHPEICIRDVSGAPEDVAMRGKPPLDGDDRRCQRFRFLTRAGQSVVVYYWHYRLPPAPAARTVVQELHLRLAGAAPSLTVQVTMAGEDRAAVELVEKTLLPAIDRAVRSTAPDGTVVGCDRLPIPLVRE